MCFFTCSPRPPMLSQPKGVKIWPFPLLWLFAFTTPCTTIQAVIFFQMLSVLMILILSLLKLNAVLENIRLLRFVNRYALVITSS